ncbi:hypothetical protein A9Q89_03720 [Gammaproteobacteria bacterium 53_120_T64]|nr:hypothetical protein A9Q89_03720 [Gammaproteobacteria bacterium 53_120_T64]
MAIKVLRHKDENLIAFANSSDEEGLAVLRERFLREARILAQLEDKLYIVNALELGELDDGSPWYTMPFVPRSLADELGKDIFDEHALAELSDAK